MNPYNRRLVRETGRAYEKNLLVVDDQPQMRDMLRVMLKKNGFANLSVAESGKQALRTIS